MKWVGFVLLLFFIAPPLGEASADTSHAVSHDPTGYGTVSLSSFDERIENSAKDYQREYPSSAIARIVLFDSALPLDEAEYAATGKNGILLLSALSHEEDELPLANAYLGGVKLTLLGSKRRQNPTGSATRKQFGVYRVDSFYLVPIERLRKDPTVSADFAKNRVGFLVGQSTWEEPAFMIKDQDPHSGPAPSIAAIKALIDREYPGFGIEPSL